MYCEEISINEDNVTHILYAARKYGISKVTKECRSFLEKNINPDNVCVIAENAHIFDEEELFKMCLDYIIKHAFESIHSEAFTQLCQSCVTKIIERDDLPLDEDHILECMTHWAKKQCSRQSLAVTEENQRAALGDLFYLIRFPIMNLTYFADNVAKNSKLLTFLQICDSVDISASCLTFVDVDYLSLSTRQQNRSLLEQTFIQMNFKIFSS